MQLRVAYPNVPFAKYYRAQFARTFRHSSLIENSSLVQAAASNLFKIN